MTSTKSDPRVFRKILTPVPAAAPVEAVEVSEAPKKEAANAKKIAQKAAPKRRATRAKG